MATKNIVPRANNEGSIGTAAKNWSDIRATSITVTNLGNAAVVAAGDATHASMTFTAGTPLTASAAGALEKDANVFYTTPIAGARGISPSTQFAIVEAGDFGLATTSGVQVAFPSTKDVWTLAATTTYFVEGFYAITHTTTTCTAAIAFLAGGGLTITSMDLWVESSINAANAIGTSHSTAWVNQLASTVVTVTSTAGWIISFTGLIRVNAGGKIGRAHV